MVTYPYSPWCRRKQGLEHDTRVIAPVSPPLCQPIRPFVREAADRQLSSRAGLTSAMAFILEQGWECFCTERCIRCHRVVALFVPKDRCASANPVIYR